MLGVNSALETFVSQAWGRQNLKDCGLNLHRALLLVTICYIPIAVASLYFETALENIYKGKFVVLQGA